MISKVGVLAVSGYGINITVERGHLVVEDGVGNERRRGRFARVPRKLKRVVVLGHSGIISLEALRWLHDVGASFVQIDNDGKLITASTRPSLKDSRLRRAQALATTNGVGVEIGRDLIRQKLEGQAKLLERLPAPSRDFFEIPELVDALREDDSPQELRRTEGQAAIIYWSAWSDVPVNFEARDAERIPEHWLKFGQRHSLISKPSPRRAVNPANAILNYLYAILEAEARIAALSMGLDPGLGFLHADQQSRDSLPCDLMEAVRLKVDSYVLDLLRSRTFRKADFFETREGICRLMPPFTHELGETGAIWARDLGPVTERVARMLFEAARNPKMTTNNYEPKSARKRALPTPLTESNRSAGREPYKREQNQRASS